MLKGLFNLLPYTLSFEKLQDNMDMHLLFMGV